MASTQKLKKFKKQHGLCLICWKEMIYPPKGPFVGPAEEIGQYATWEHIIPKSEGGSNKLKGENLCLTHLKCNAERDRAPVEVVVELCPGYGYMRKLKIIKSGKSLIPSPRIAVLAKES